MKKNIMKFLIATFAALPLGLPFGKNANIEVKTIKNGLDIIENSAIVSTLNTHVTALKKKCFQIPAFDQSCILPRKGPVKHPYIQYTTGPKGPTPIKEIAVFKNKNEDEIIRKILDYPRLTRNYIHPPIYDTICKI